MPDTQTLPAIEVRHLTANEIEYWADKLCKRFKKMARAWGRERYFQDLDELVSIALLEFGVALKKFKGPVTEPAIYKYCRICIENALKDAIQKHYRARGEEPYLEEMQPKKRDKAVERASEDREARTLATAENQQRVELLLQAMPPRDREIVTGHLIKGLSFFELGQEMRITENNARQRFNRALKRLKEIFNPM